MQTKLEVLFTPAEFSALNPHELPETVCVVFDVLRATTSMIAALAQGAVRIFPVGKLPKRWHCNAGIRALCWPASAMASASARRKQGGAILIWAIRRASSPARAWRAGKSS